MQDIHTMLGQLRRPALLTEAAQLASAHYRSETHLPPLLGAMVPRRPVEAVLALVEMEADMNHQRRARSASYSARLHVRLLSALIAEAGALSAS